MTFFDSPAQLQHEVHFGENSTATPAHSQVPTAWSTVFQPLMFSLWISSWVIRVSCMQPTPALCFLIHSGSGCLWTGELRSFTLRGAHMFLPSHFPVADSFSFNPSAWRLTLPGVFILLDIFTSSASLLLSRTPWGFFVLLCFLSFFLECWFGVHEFLKLFPCQRPLYFFTNVER